MKKILLLMSLSTCFIFNEAYSQKIVKGTIRSSDNILLSGATVSLKNSKISTISNSEGKFEISLPAEKVLLDISYVGYQSKSVTVGANETSVLVSLTQSTANQLNDVVVIGYGTRQKGELTGAVSKISDKTFEDRPLTNTLSALQGAMPGVTVTRGSGQPGRENYSLQIRGASSINGDKVLVLIDGIPGDLNLLNPNDIAGVTVLKDASASIYGARAADGVVLVTTKKGKKGIPRISYSTNYALKTPRFLKKMANTLHMAEMYDEGMKNIGQPGVSQAVFDSIRANAEPDVSSGWIKYLEAFPGFYQSHNWNDAVYGTGIQQMHNLTISGGGENNDYLFSAGYERNEGTFKVGENRSDRYNLRMNYDFKFFDRLSIETRTSFANEQIIEPAGLSTALYMATKIGSYVPIFNPQGEYYKYQGGFRNPLLYLDPISGVSKSNNSNFSSNVKADLEILNNLKLIAQLGVVLSFNDANATHPTFNEYNWDGSVFGMVNVPNSADYSNSKNIYKNATAYLDYSKNLFSKDQINLMAGASHEENDLSGQSITGHNFSSNELFTLNLADRTNPAYATFSGNASDWTLQSYFGRLSYSYNKKYLMDFTTRVDGSSKFAPSKRWSELFPSIAVAWNLSEEKFIQDLNLFDYLKLRGSWGESGNQDLVFGNYDYIPLISITGIYPIGSPNVGLPGAVPNIASTDRTWETIETKNIGIDFAFLNSRLTGSLDYYIKYNNDMLVNADLPATLGGTAPSQNLGKLRTKGWDFNVGWNDAIGDFKYSISAMVSDSKNKLVELKGNDSYSEGLVNTRQGYPLQSYFGYKFEGIIKDSKQLDDYKKLGNVPSKIGLGDVMYKDVDGDGKITPFGDPSLGTKGDLIYLGNLSPRYEYSSNIDLSYKGFDLSIFLQGIGKRNGMITGVTSRPMYTIYYQPLDYWYGKSWTPGNPNAKYPRIVPGAVGFDDIAGWDWRTSSMHMLNLAYLKLKALTLAYNLPQNIIKRYKIQNLRIYLSGTDLLTISKGTMGGNFNPEEVWQEFDEQTYPFSSSVSLGLDVKF